MEWLVKGVCVRSRLRSRKRLRGGQSLAGGLAVAVIMPEHDPAIADLIGRHVRDGRGFTTGQGQVMDIGFTEFSLDKFLEKS